MSQTFSEILSNSPVLIDLRAKDEIEAIRTVAGLLATSPEVGDVGKLTNEVIERERLCPTAMGHGVAFPHARTIQVRQIVVAIGRSREGIPFPPDDEPVHFLFVIGTPPDRVPQYLALMGKLARLLKTGTVRDGLMAAATPQSFLQTLLSAG